MNWFIVIATFVLCVHPSCVAENVTSHTAIAAAVPRVHMEVNTNDSVDTCNRRSWYMQMLAGTNRRQETITHNKQERAGKAIPRLDSQVVNSNRSSTTVSYVSDGHISWLSSVDVCSLSVNRSYLVCYYVAMYHHVCLQNVTYHDVNDDDNARQHLMNKRSVAETEMLTTDRASAGYEDVTIQAESMKVNISIPLSSHKTSGPSTDADTVIDEVSANESVSAAATAVKEFNTSTTTNTTQKSSASEKNEKTAASEATVAETETTTTTKATTTSGNTSTPAAVDDTTTTKQTYKDIENSITSSTGSKISSSQRPNVINTSTGSGNITVAAIANSSVDSSDSINTCSRKSWYTQMLTDTHRRSLQANIDQVLASNIDDGMLISSSELASWKKNDRDGENIYRLDSQVVSNRSATTVSYVSDGHNSWLSSVDVCSFSDNRSYLVCYYVAMYHHVCLQNVTYHDVNEDDNARQHMMNQRSVAETETLTTDRPSVEHEDMTIEAELMKVNTSIPLSSHKTPVPSSGAVDVKGDATADENVSAAATAAKEFNTLAIKKNENATASTVAETEMITKTTETITNGNSSTSAPVNMITATNPTFEGSAKSGTSSDGSKISNSGISNVDAGSSTSAGNTIVAAVKDTQVHASDFVDTCNLLSWYMHVLASTHRRQETTSFQANTDKVLASNVLMSSGELDSNYRQLLSWEKKEHGGQAVHHVDSQVVNSNRSSTIVSYVSDGHNSWLSSVDVCSLSVNRSYLVCYYVAMYHHVCLQNVTYHDVNEDDNARQHLMNKRSVAETEMLTTDRASAGYEDVTIQGESIKVNKSIPLSSDRTSMTSTFADGVIHDVRAGERVSAAANSAKKYSILPTANDKASEETVEETEIKARTKAESASGNTSTPAAVDKTTTKLTYEDIMKTDTAHTGSTLNYSKISNIDAKININISEHVNQHDFAKDTKPSSLKIDLLPAGNETWLADSTDSVAMMEVELNHGTKDRGHQSAGSPADDRKQRNAKDHVKFEEKNDATTCRRSWRDVFFQCKQRLQPMKVELLQLDNQLLQSTVDRTNVTTNVKLENYVMRLELELVRLNESFVELKTENEQLRQRYLEAMAETNKGDQQHNIDEPSDIVSNQSSLLVALQEKYADLERESQLFVDQCELRLRPVEMKLLQLENQLLQSAVDHASITTTSVELNNYVVRVEREVTELSRSFVKMKAENELLRQKYLKAAAATSIDEQQHNFDELTDIINNQSSLLVALQDKYDGLERDNQLFVDQCELRLRPMEMKLLQLENQLLQSTVNHTTRMSTTVELENYIMRVERELTGLSRSFVEMKAENEQLRQKNLEVAATTNTDDKERNFDELTDIVNNQASLLVALQDKYAALERDNRLLVERLLNQSLMMNEMMLQVETLGKEQARQTLQLMEFKQRGDDSWRSVTVSQDQRSSTNYAAVFPGSPVYNEAPKGRLCSTYFLFRYSSLVSARITARRPLW